MIKLIAGLLASAFIATSAMAQEIQMKPLGAGAYGYFSDGYNSLVVIGDKGALVVDPAWSARAENIKKAVADVTDKPITHVVLTHEHYDHVGGTEVFKNAKIVCHSTCEKIFELDITGQAPKKVDLTFDEQMTIDLGGKTVELKHLGVGDGFATTVVYVPENQVVATADMYGPKFLTNAMWLEDKNYLGTRKILNEVASWPLKHALSGHSPDTSPVALKENAEYLNDLYEAVKKEIDAAMKAGGPGAVIKALAGPLPNKVKLPKYQDWQGYDQHFPKHVWRMGMSIFHGG